MYILALGCSWTDAAYRSWSHPDMDCSWTKWPDHVGKMLDVEVVNRGRSGTGNMYAFQELMKYVSSDNPPDHVIWQLTNWTRLQMGQRQMVPGLRMSQARLNALSRGHSPEYMMGITNLPLALDGPIPFFKETLSLILKAIGICRKLGIKIHIFQSDVNPTPWDRNYFLNYLEKLKVEYPKEYETFMFIIDNRTHNLEITQEDIRTLIALEDFQTITEMDPPELYGWPIFHELEGKRILSNSPISKEDSHPNAQGQINIAAGVLNWIK